MVYWADDRALDMEQRRLDADQARAKRRMQTMTKRYKMTNPQQIIDLFDARSVSLDLAAAQQKVNVAKVLMKQAETWRAAADILRNTEFVGWDLAAAATLRDPNAPPITKADYDWPTALDGRTREQKAKDDVEREPIRKRVVNTSSRDKLLKRYKRKG